MTTPAKTPGATPSGQAIAARALTYAGQRYTYGGRGDHPGDWDCSSFVSYVLGHDFGLALPGGGHYGDSGYPPNVHGPVVVSYAGWAGATTISGPPAAGDLVIWPGLGPFGHIGIALDGSRMVSALDTADGTRQTGIPATLHGAGLVVRRVNGAGQIPGAAGSGSLGDLTAATLAGLSVPVVMIGVLFAVVIGAAILAVVGGSVAAGAVISRGG